MMWSKSSNYLPRTHLSTTWLVLSTVGILILGAVTAHAVVIDSDIDDGSVIVEASYFQDPATGVWTSAPVGLVNDRNGYRFELVCFDLEEGNGDVSCIGGLQISCDAAENGRVVQWYTGLKGTSEDSWAKFGPPSCIYDEKPASVTEQIRAVILSEFQSRPITPGSLGMQPSPHTLIGAQTNFYVDAQEQVFDFVLLEQDIRIIATPTEYEWNYGDGTSYGPALLAGGPLPQSRWGEETLTSHVYSATGDFQASVVVYFSGEYSVNGGPFVPIDGRATVPSAPQNVSVWRADSNNVADNCLVNPAGFGC